MIVTTRKCGERLLRDVVVRTVKYAALVFLFCSTVCAQSIPHSFRVGRQAWTVDLHRSPMIVNQMEVMGYTDCASHRILLEVPRPANDLAEALLHEVLHAATGCTSKITDIHGGMHGAIWEISTPLRQILADNPQLTRYLSQKNRNSNGD
jgi:hypothetical protein